MRRSVPSLPQYAFMALCSVKAQEQILYYSGPLTWRLKNQLVTKCYTEPQNWRALVNTLMNLRIP